MADDDRLDLVVQVIKAREAKRQLESVESAVDKMTDAQRRAATAAQDGARKTTEANDQVKESYTEFNAALEIVNRVLGMARQAAQLYAAALDSVVQRSMNTEQSFAGLQRATEGLRDAFAEGAVEGGGLAQSLREVSQASREAEGLANDVGHGFSFISMTAVAATRDIATLARGLATLSPAEALRTIHGRMEERAASVQAGETQWLQDFRASQPSWIEPEGSHTETEGGYAEAARRAREQSERQARGRRGGGGGSRQEDTYGEAEYMARATEQLFEARQQYYQMVIDKEGEISEYRQEAAREELEQMQALAGEQYRVMNTRLDSTLQSIDAENAARQMLHDDEKERLREITSLQQQRMNESITKFGQYASAVTQVAGAFGNVFGQLAANEEAGSEAAKKYGKIQGGIMAGIAFVQSAIEYAKAVGSAAKYEYGAMAQHIAAGIAYDAAGHWPLRTSEGQQKAELSLEQRSGLAYPRDPILRPREAGLERRL